MNQLSFKQGERQFFWDNYLIDNEKTTAKLTLHHPVYQQEVLRFDNLWEGDGCDYFNIIHDGDIYRMYYTAANYSYRNLGFFVDKMPDGSQNNFYICYAESKDGITWKKPDLGINEFMGGTENNIVLAPTEDVYFIDSFFVFIDNNPNCPTEEKYKAVVMEHSKIQEKPLLYCYTSADAIHFKQGWILQDEGAFDSLNTAMWDEENQIYHCFLRGKHPNKGKNSIGFNRDIRHMVSKDFKNWSNPEIIEYEDPYEFEMYTNVISKYYRSANVFIGFPTRYVERSFDPDYWTDNYEQLGNKQWRQYIMHTCSEPRIGLSTTDCLFMVSHDGYKWHRFCEAFVTPGPETKHNWVYGDCYPAYGIIETENSHGIKELSMYFPEGHFSGKHATLSRHTVRIDGFASFKADFEQKRIVTKPFVFNGEELEINFKTSAMGNIYVNILDENENKIEGYSSCEIFGDSTARRIKFDKSLNELSGKNVRLEILMSDADIFSFVFK